MKRQASLALAITLPLLCACAQTDRLGASARDAGLAAADAASEARTRAEILAMPKTQTGWIAPSAATDTTQVGIAPPTPIASGPIGSTITLPDPVDTWDYEQIREWRVRLANGKTYAVTQAGPRMTVGQEVMVVRYGASLALVD